MTYVRKYPPILVIISALTFVNVNWKTKVCFNLHFATLFNYIFLKFIFSHVNFVHTFAYTLAIFPMEALIFSTYFKAYVHIIFISMLYPFGKQMVVFTSFKFLCNGSLVLATCWQSKSRNHLSNYKLKV